MTDQEKTKEELLIELQLLRQECQRLKTLPEKNLTGLRHEKNVVTPADQRLHELMMWAQIGLWQWDLENDTVVWSDKLFQIAGQDSSRPAPTYAEHSHIYTPDSWEILRTAVEKTLQTGEPYRLDLELIRPDGTIRSLNACGGAQYDESSEKIVGLYGWVQDDTARKQSDMALKESESNFEKVVNAMLETFSIIDEKGNFLYANAHAAKNLSGGQPSDVVGKNITHFVAPAQASSLIETYGRIISTKQPVQEEIMISFADGNKWFLNTLQFITWGPEKMPAILSVSLDITKTKETENELRLSEARNRLLSSVTMEGILIHRNGIARDLNLSLANMLGFEYEELLNKDFFEIVHADDHPLVRENIVKEHALPFVVRAIRKNGELINIEVESKNFQYNDEKWRVSAIRDVTTRKQSEELMRTMAEMLDLAPSSITVHDTTGRFVYANQKTFAIHGYTEPEFMAINLHHLDVPASAALLAERFRKIEESKHTSFEVAHYHKDGHEIPMEVFARRVEWRGQPAILSIATDITERKLAGEEIVRAKELAEASEARFRNYIQNSPTSVFLTNNQGRYTFVNNSACNLLGYSETELLHMSIRDLAAPGVAVDEIESFNELKRVGVIRNVEKKLIRKDGQSIDVVLDGKKLSENEYIAFIKDITERKKAEEALRVSEEKMWRIYSVAPVGMGVVANRILKEVNPRICEMTGYTREELLEQSTRLLYLTQEDYEYVGTEKYEQIREKGTGKVETRWMKKDGTIINILLASTPIDTSDIAKGVIFTALDITDRKNAELLVWEKTKEIEGQNEELQQINEELNQTNQELAAALEQIEESERLLTKIADNYPNSIVSVIKDDLTIGFSGGQEFMRQQLNPNDFIGLTPEEIFGAFSDMVREQYTKTFNGEETSFELLINNQYQLYKTVPLFDEHNQVVRILSVVENITTRKLAEKELLSAKKRAEESEEKYKALYNNAPLSYQSLDDNGCLIDINPMWLKTLGYDRNEVIGKWFGDFLEPGYVEHFMVNFPAFKLRGFISDVQFLLRKKDNSYIFVSYEGCIGYTPDGKFKQTYCVFTDITEQKKAELALRETEERFRTANNASLDSLLLLRSDRDEAGNIRDFIFLDVNSSTEAMLCRSRDQLIGHRLCEELPINREANFFEKYKHVVETGIPLQEEFYLPETHVPACWYFHQVVKVDDGVFICHRDISEQKKAEEEIIKAKEKAEESKQHFQSLIENAPDGVVIIDAQGRFTYGSPNAARHFGYTDDDIIGHSGQEYTHPDDLPIVLKALEAIMNDPHVKPKLKYRFKRKNGDYRWIETTFSNLLSEKAINGIVLNFTDVTEREQIFEELKIAKEKAEESDRLKSAFLANMSHEIRTPMNGILGFAELLKEPSLTGDEQKEYIRIIEKSGARMLNIINEIVDISKIEAGLMEINISETNIDEMMDFTCQFFKPEVESKGLSFLYHNNQKTCDVIIKTDKEKLNAILFNLVKNAIKYTKKGTVEIGYSLNLNDKKEENSPNRKLEFFIKDTGIGIPADRVEAIFERFIQADVLDKNAMQGAGLGLSISKAYVEMLGGHIRVESEEGAGTIFYFTIPCHPAKQQEEDYQITALNGESHVGLKSKKSELKILIVEDDEASELFISAAVKGISAEILKATTGIDAVNYCHDHPDIDLVLMDIRMPVMDGYTAIRRIREFNKKMIIIAQTAYGLAGDREKSLEAGANDYISKPVKKSELLLLIQKHFKERK